MKPSIAWMLLAAVVGLSALTYWHVKRDASTGATLRPPVSAPQNSADEVSAESAQPRIVNAGQKTAEVADGDSGTEIVQGIRVRKDRNCTVQVRWIENAEGTMIKAFECVPNTTKQQDIYTTYSNQELATLAYSDAHAAHVLSKRLRETDFDNAFKLALQSTALSGDTLPIQWLAQHYPASTTTDGVVNLKTIEDRYVMSRVVMRLDDTQDLVDYWKNKAEQHRTDGIDLAALDQRVDDILAEVDRMSEQLRSD